ncbi:MAG: hypothetical protein A2018_07345 [Alphaproteobacteria bacterium GWF2_58_20]|nr:MAG: hypothetical protein A2018_07345 [Alphaproteobacteria bacterium GWF2_58_20]
MVKTTFAIRGGWVMKKLYGLAAFLTTGFLVFQPVMAQSVASGAFLAGRFAQSHGDWARASGYFNQALLADSSNPVLLRQGFLLALASGQVEAARNLGRSILAKGDSYHMAEVLAVADAFVAHDSAKAGKLVSAMPEDGLGGLLKPILAGWVLALDGKYTKAQALLEPGSKDEGMGALYALHVGLLAELSGKMFEAEKWYRTSLDVAVTSRAAQALAALLQKQGRMDEAEAVLAEMDRAMPGWERAPGAKLGSLVTGAQEGVAELLFDMALVLEGQDMGEAASLYAQVALVLKPGFAEAHILLGEAMLESGQEQAALEQFRQVSETSWAWWPAQLGMAQILENLDRGDEAVALLRKMGESSAENVVPQVRLADLLRRQKRFAEAAAAYEMALARLDAEDSRAWELHYWCGASLEQAGAWPKAEAELRLALAKVPDHPLVLNYLGYSLVDRGEKLAEAFAMLQKAAEMRPEGFILDSLGWAHFRMGHYADAVRYLDEAVALDPADATINDHLGDAYWRMGRHREARFQWLRARGLAGTQDAAFRAAMDAKLDKGLSNPADLVDGYAKAVAE